MDGRTDGWMDGWMDGDDDEGEEEDDEAAADADADNDDDDDDAWTRLLASGPLMGTLLGRVAAGLGRNTQPKQGANWCACRGSGTVVL